MTTIGAQVSLAVSVHRRKVFLLATSITSIRAYHMVYALSGLFNKFQYTGHLLIISF